MKNCYRAAAGIASRMIGASAGLLLMVAVSAAPAQELRGSASERDPACDSQAAHQFDFWIGDWQVQSRQIQADGSWHEVQEQWTARPIIGGCAIEDFAEGDFGGGMMRGFGLRYYNPTTDEWSITWMSTGAPGQLGVWTGKMSGTGGDFLSAAPDGGVVTRIRWEDVSADGAHWEYAVSQDEGVNWRTVWIMDFSRAASDPASTG